MPFYEYECSNCNHYLEVLQKISDAPLRKCPNCKRQTLKKLVSAPVFRLKGDGWYETDFKGEGEDKRNLADREEPTEKSEDSKDTGDTKSDGAKQAKPEVRTAARKAPAKPAPTKSTPSRSTPSRTAARTAAPKVASRAASGAASRGKKPVAKAPARRPAPKKAAAKKQAKRR